VNTAARIVTPAPPEIESPLVLDRFTDARRAGTVIGSRATSGAVRLGCDAERQMAIDNGALRLQPLIRPGWGRESIAYGPFRREAGLTLAVSITNGHNTSQGTAIEDSYIKRLRRWALGPEADPLPRRLRAWAFGPRRKGTLRRFIWWARSRRAAFANGEHHENLAVGFFAGPAPADPLVEGSGFIVHAAEGENGELWTRSGARCLSAFRRLKNLQVCYVVALRERGAVYYAAALPGAHGVGDFPMLRPIAIDAFDDTETVFGGVHQCVLGQIGFRVDTRVQSIQIGRVPEFAPAFATAHISDPLTGDRALTGSALAGNGPAWRVLRGAIGRAGDGAAAVGGGDALAMADAGAPSGLVHALVETGPAAGSVGLAWRGRDEDNFWLWRVTGEGSAIIRVEDGSETIVAADRRPALRADAVHALQILDHDGRIGCYVDGEQLFGTWLEDPRGADATGVGFWLDGAGSRLRDFEAHPREIPLPPTLAFDPPWQRLGRTPEIADAFAGPAGDLLGRRPDRGAGGWRRDVGIGEFVVEPSGGLRIRGSAAAPHPGRTFYTLPWSCPDFADLAVTITPPGTGRGERHHSRAGLVFWQDPDNYVSCTTYLEDIYQGASTSFFTKRQGFEEIYDAIWTMVWDQIDWGKPVRLRIPFDGRNFLVYLDDEPVLQRALTDIYPDDAPLRINRVGLAANWEWGRDTGSRFARFEALR
jgi:hypothetical protein